MTDTPTRNAESTTGHWSERLADLRSKTVDFLLEHRMGAALTVWAGTFAAQTELVQSGALWANPYASPAAAAVHLALPVAAYAGLEFFKERREKQESEAKARKAEDALAERYARDGIDGVDKMALPLRDWNLNDDNPQFMAAVHEAIKATENNPDAADRFKELMRSNEKMREAVVQFMQKYNVRLAHEASDASARNRASNALSGDQSELQGPTQGR